MYFVLHSTKRFHIFGLSIIKNKVMKQSHGILSSSLTAEQLQTLILVINETLAYNVVKSAAQKKIFTSAELWNIQKKVKTRAQRRFL
jgi:CobQ-like glutamine amidotransferase family enzyme